MRRFAIVVCLIFAALPAFGEGYTKTNNFTTGTAASAAEVNANFDEVETAVNDNASDIDALQAAPPAHTVSSHSDTTATGTELDTLTDGSNGDALHVHAYEAADAAIVKSDETETLSVAWDLGTPSAMVGTNLSGTGASFTAGTATVSTTSTITDNEATNETNALTFTAGGDVDGGDIGLESDGDLTYNPSSGTLAATEFSGGGVGITDMSATELTSGTVATGRLPTAVVLETEVLARTVSTATPAAGNACTVGDTWFESDAGIEWTCKDATPASEVWWGIQLSASP